MRILLCAVLGVLTAGMPAYASTDFHPSIDSAPITVIGKEELGQTSGARTIDDLTRNLPSLADSQVRASDYNQAQVNLRGSLTLLDGKRLTKAQQKELGDFLSADAQSIPLAMIERVEVLKDGAGSLYGSDAVAGVVNIITTRPMDLDLQPQAEAWLPKEKEWADSGLPFGRIGVRNDGGTYSYGLSTSAQGNWDWAPSWNVGASYGLNGPIIAVGKTPQGPALSIYNEEGAWIGGVTKAKIAYNPSITAQYLIRAEYPALNPAFTKADWAYDPLAFSPEGVFVLPRNRRLGDLFQTGDILNSRLSVAKDYDDMDDFEEDGCVPPYLDEPIYPRTVQKKKAKAPEVPLVPNDPLYKKSAKKKSGGIPIVSGLVSVGAGVMGGGTRMEVDDDDGPEVFDQYSLPQIGFLPKTDAGSAWNLVDADARNVTVAVIDSGLDVSHPDGPQYIWTNPKEVAGNGKDDDNNGYVDDVNGWNFIDENNDLRDLRGHGTIVTGIIAARTNNGEGIAGINPGAVIMPLKVTDKNGNTNSLLIYRAVRYAVAHGARVINISLGARNVSKLEQLAVNYARMKGVLVVVAAGNEGGDIMDHGPAAVGSAVVVGAVNFDGTRGTVSNWGANNTLMAPGEKIYSLHSKDARWDGPAGLKNHLYTKATGTSFAAPMVAAIASLLIAKNPLLTPDQVEDAMVGAAHRMGKEEWEGRTGAGVVDAAAAFKYVNESHFNVKVTGLKPVYKPKSKQIEYVDVYATVRGDVDYFTVEVGKGKNARTFKAVMGLAGQQASDDLVARVNSKHLRGSSDWQVVVRAVDKSGKEHIAQLPLVLK